MLYAESVLKKQLQDFPAYGNVCHSSKYFDAVHCFTKYTLIKREAHWTVQDIKQQGVTSSIT